MTKRNDDGGRSRSGPRSIASVLQDVVARLGLERDLDDFRVWQAWAEVVGPTLARNAQPIRLDGLRLVVAVKNNSWMQELAMLRGEIAARLNAWMGRRVVGEIFLVVGRLDAPHPGRARRTSSGAAPAAHSPADAIDRLWKPHASESDEE